MDTIIKNGIETINNLKHEIKKDGFQSPPSIIEIEFKRKCKILLKYIATIKFKNCYNMDIKYYVAKYINPFEYSDFIDEINNYSIYQFIEELINTYDTWTLIDMIYDIISIFINIRELKNKNMM